MIKFDTEDEIEAIQQDKWRKGLEQEQTLAASRKRRATVETTAEKSCLRYLFSYAQGTNEDK